MEMISPMIPAREAVVCWKRDSADVLVQHLDDWRHPVHGRRTEDYMSGLACLPMPSKPLAIALHVQRFAMQLVVVYGVDPRAVNRALLRVREYAEHAMDETVRVGLEAAEARP